MSHSLDGLNANSAKIICSGFYPFHREKQKIPDMELVIFAKLTKRFIIPLVRPLFLVWSSGVISTGQLTYGTASTKNTGFCTQSPQYGTRCKIDVEICFLYLDK